MKEIAFCDFEAGWYLIFGPAVPSLVYYSHIPILIASLVLGSFVLLQGWKKLENRVLFFTLIPFALWVFLDAIFWASNRSDIIMAAWAIIILIEPLVYIGCLYLMYVLIEKKDVSFPFKLFWGIIYLPLIIFTPSNLFLSGFDLTSCLAIETPLAYYSYFVEGLAIFCILTYAVVAYFKYPQTERRIRLAYLTGGIILFLLAFAWGNITGSFTENWKLGQYGLFGMPIFLGVICYLMVRYRTFNVKLLGSQALVAVVWFVLFAILFIDDIPYAARIILSINLLLFTALGFRLVKSVEKEIQLREEIEKLAKDLAKANARLRKLDQLKSEFVSIASHQLRSPLTSIRGYTSMILEGSYGKINKKVTDIISRIQASSRYMALTVEDFLNVSRIESGTMKYAPSDFDICDMVKTVYEDIKPAVTEKQLDFTFASNIKGICTVHADAGKVRQIIQNLIDNATKYTPKGSIAVTLNEQKDKEMVEIIIKDTGIGMAPETLHEIFHKFARAKNANTVNVIGSGLGLYVAKEMAEKMGGSIKAESEGEGKGSTFTIYLPLAGKKTKSSK